MPKRFSKVVGETTHDVTEKSRDALQQAGDYIAPIARDAAERGAALAAQAGERIGPLARDAAERGAALAREAGDYLGPIAEDAKRKGARLAADTMDKVQPHLDDAIDKVSPAFEEAYKKVAPVLDAALDKLQTDLVPRFQAALHEAADHPVTVESRKRLQAATAALAGELELPEPKRKTSVGKTIAKVAIAGALLAGVAVALKKFFAPADSGWQAHQPSPAYRPEPTNKVADDLKAKAADAAAKVSSVVEQAADKAADAAEDVQAKAEDVVDQVKDKVDEIKENAAEAKADAEATADADGLGQGDAAPFADSPWGEGSYVGSEPPEGFVIKGNERSMKFHVVGGGGYDRTIADVWFATEDAAEAAGFVKAKR